MDPRLQLSLQRKAWARLDVCKRLSWFCCCRWAVLLHGERAPEVCAHLHYPGAENRVVWAPYRLSPTPVFFPVMAEGNKRCRSSHGRAQFHPSVIPGGAPSKVTSASVHVTLRRQWGPKHRHGHQSPGAGSCEVSGATSPVSISRREAAPTKAAQPGATEQPGNQMTKCSSA